MSNDTKLDEYEIWLLIKGQPDYIQASLLDQYCQNDNSLRRSLEQLIRADNATEKLHDVISGAFDQLQDSNFDTDILIGAKVGKYTIKRLHKVGGFGFVYYAERSDDVLHGKPAAIKVIKPELSNIFSHDLVKREASIMSTLRDENIVESLDYGIVEKDKYRLPCYIMEYIDGIPIDEYFSSPLSSVRDRITSIIEICKSLHTAHEMDVPVVHLDLKPANILIEKNKGLPKILDFGIAQHAYEADLNGKISHSGYSCPEIKEVGQLKATADVYSVGMILYQVMTGLTPPFDVNKNKLSKNLAYIAGKNEYKRWMSELDSIVAKATAQDYRDRYVSTQALQSSLQRFLDYKYCKEVPYSKAQALYKYFYIKPVHASFAVAGAIGATFGLTVLSIWSMWAHQHAIDSALKQDQFAIINKHVNDSFTSKDDSIKSLYFIERYRSLLEHTNADPELIYDYAIDIGKNANIQNQREVAKNAFELALQHAPKDELIVTTGLLAKALMKLGEFDKADKLTRPIFDNYSSEGFASSIEALVYIDLFDTNFRFISDSFDDDRSDYEVLKSIYDNYSHKLPSAAKAQLLYHLSVESYWTHYGDTISPSLGFSDEEYISLLRKNFKASKSWIDLAISLTKSKDELFLYLDVFKSWSARVHYELKDYEIAKYLVEEAEASSNTNESLDAFTKQKILRNSYSVNRFLDLQKSVSVLTKGIEVRILPYSLGNYLQSLYLLTDAQIAVGDKSKVEELVKKGLHHYKAILKDENSADFVELDSLSVLFANYVDFVNFDLNNNLAKESAIAFSGIMHMTIKNFPSMVEPVELIRADLFKDYYLKDIKRVSNAVSELYGTRNKSSKANKTEDYGILLNIAVIMSNLGDHEFAQELAKASESFTQWSSIEQTHSTVKMQTYLALARVYRDNGNYSRFANALSEAKIVFNNHREALTGSYYEPIFVELDQSIVAKLN